MIPTTAYITADEIGIETGGGLVTYQEREALRAASVTMYTFQPKDRNTDPFNQDRQVVDELRGMSGIKLAHLYAGSFSQTVSRLHSIEGCKVTYTCAAHDIEVSRAEHLAMGLPFDYPHLNDPGLWKEYSRGYREADVLICPSAIAAETCKKQGCTNRIEIIPHGCTIPAKVKPLPKMFTVGYMGAVGPDKGVRYLLAAWAKLRYRDAVLVLAGRHSSALWNIRQGGNINILGWVESPSLLYDACTLYVQPSATEGFGCEVIEAMAHGRAALCSNGAGAADAATMTCAARNVDQLAELIDEFKRQPREQQANAGMLSRGEIERNYTWEKIRQRYVNLWRSL